VVNVAVVTPLVVLRVPVPRVVVPLVKVTVPEAGAGAPAVVGTVNVSTTGEPKAEVVGFAVSVSEAPLAAATVSVVEDEIGPKLPAAGAVAVMVSVPTGKAVVVVVATQEVGLMAGTPAKFAVPSVVPPLAKLTGATGQTPLTGAMVSLRVTVMPYISPVEGEAVSVPVGVTGVTVSVAVAEPAP
jgi:hypothetical protein